jgi:SAM-dependent methyltransferase
MPSNQDDIFTAFEGDNYFARNKVALEGFDPEQDLPLRLMNLYGLSPRSAVEIGAANGCRLDAIAERYGARVVGVDPSANAIESGRKCFPHVEFLQATAANVPLQDVFDLVIVNFVLHWIDRSTLLRSVAEIDRLVADGGFLLVGDFAPDNFLRVHYHHLAEKPVYTYKQDYSAVFVASGLYHTVATLKTSHGSPSLSAAVSESERTSVWLLQKQLQDHYVESGGPHSR